MTLADSALTRLEICLPRQGTAQRGRLPGAVPQAGLPPSLSSRAGSELGLELGSELCAVQRWVPRCRQGAVLHVAAGHPEQAAVQAARPLRSSAAGGRVPEGRGERCSPISLRGTGTGDPSGSRAWCRDVSGGWGRSPQGHPARCTAPGAGRDACPRSSSLQGVKDMATAGHCAVTGILNFPRPHKANSAAVPSSGANGRDGWPGPAGRSCRSRLPGHAPRRCHPPQQPA